MLYRNFWSHDPRIQNLHREADITLCSYFGECLFPIRAYALPRPKSIFARSTVTPKPKSIPGKDAVIEIDKSYRNIQMYAASRKTYTNCYSRTTTQRFRYSVNDVFEVSPKFRRDRSIIFNFIGSNQLGRSQLRAKQLDSRYNVQCNYRRYDKTFLTYERTTRCIKYCNSRKTCAGDMFLFL